MIWVPPHGAITACVYYLPMLSRGTSTLVYCIIDPIISALFVDEEHFSDAALGISIQLRALHLVLYSVRSSVADP